MLNALIRLSLRNRVAVLVLSALACGAGAVSLSRLSIDAFPDVTDVMVQVNTVAPGMAPLEMEQQVSARVESAMGGMRGLKLVRSISKFGLSQVTLVFEDGTDIWFARAQVLERLQAVDLPQGIGRPEMGPVSTGLGEIFHYVVTAPDGDLAAAREIHDRDIKPPLLSVPGVAEVNAWGGLERQFHVVVDPARLIRHGLTLREVVEALERSNRNVGGGVAHGSGEDLLVHGIGLASTREEIGAIALSAVDGRPVLVRDVADVLDGHEVRSGVVTMDGRGETVLGLGFMLMGENSHDVAGRLDRRLQEIRPALPPGTTVRVVYDRTGLVERVLSTVRRNLLEGALLVVAVLFLFLGHMRAALIVAAAIPISMLCAFSLMLQAGIAGTLMSLGAIDFGLVVDSSVIMVENSVRRLREDDTGRSVVEVVEEAAAEVRKPTLFGELIIMIVYLPILALHGTEGKMFRPMALTLIFALGASVVLSMTLMPVLASLLLRRGGAHVEPWIVRVLKAAYRPLVAAAVRRKGLVLGCALLCVAGAVAPATRLGSIFVPRLDEGSLVINAVRLPGVSIEESARATTAIEALLLREFPDEVLTVWSRTGTPEVATDPMGVEVSDIFITLKPREQWKKAHSRETLVRAIDRVLRPLPGMNHAFTQPIEMRFNEMVAGIRTDVGVRIIGDDLDAIRDFSTRAAAVLATVRGAAGASAEPLVGQPVLQVRLRPEALSRHGLQAADVLDYVQAAGGLDAGEVRVGQRRYPLRVRLPASVTATPERLGELLVAAPDGQRLRLSQLATLERVSGPMVVTREWGRRRALATCNVDGRDLGGFVAEARVALERELGPDLRRAGCRLEFGGQYENLERAAGTLAWVVPLALVLILALVWSTYRNFADSLRVFTGVPLALAGGVFALALRGMPLSVPAVIGFIALSGVAVLADMVLVSTIRQFLDAGIPVRDAVLRAAEQRLRPVLMTALVAGFGFLPMALSTGVGAEIQRPLATVVIGGLVSSTALTLFVVPALYVAIRGRARGA
ncbi:MAG: efflux RND transporter permease subunit [Candidatus Brocadiae bacterium]|nr:efflux RND transporter permease subunit [Candidatus Brocadiia bacterium]